VTVEGASSVGTSRIVFCGNSGTADRERIRSILQSSSSDVQLV
jgi:hypothetical protein